MNPTVILEALWEDKYLLPPLRIKLLILSIMDSALVAINVY